MGEFQERRKYPRANAEVRVELLHYTEAPMFITSSGASSKNVSAAGILLHFDKPLAPSSTILACFSLPREEEALELAARAVRSEPAEDGYDIGLEFIDCTPLEIGAIEKYVAARLDRPVPDS